MKADCVKYGIIVLVVTLASAWYGLNTRTVRALRVTFFDVGQGDAILIQAPGNVDVLIDGGPDNTVVEKLGERLPFFDRTIELLVITHPDSDHVAGLPEVARRYRVERVLFTGVTDSLPAYRILRTVFADQGTDEIYSRPGQTFELPGGRLTVVGPEGAHENTEPEESNTYSVVVRLDAGQTSFLFTGDADQAEETGMLRAHRLIKANVLKVGHHGSKSATSQEFLNAVDPGVAVISAGKDNQFGHPHPEVVERVKTHGVQILSTAEVGGVCLEVAGGIELCE